MISNVLEFFFLTAPCPRENLHFAAELCAGRRPKGERDLLSQRVRAAPRRAEAEVGPMRVAWAACFEVYDSLMLAATYLPFVPVFFLQNISNRYVFSFFKRA